MHMHTISACWSFERPSNGAPNNTRPPHRKNVNKSVSCRSQLGARASAQIGGPKQRTWHIRAYIQTNTRTHTQCTRVGWVTTCRHYFVLCMSGRASVARLSTAIWHCTRTLAGVIVCVCACVSVHECYKDNLENSHATELDRESERVIERASEIQTHKYYIQYVNALGRAGALETRGRLFMG